MIDLHMHTTCSDGSETVEEIIDSVKKAGVDFFSITDHDTAESARMIDSSLDLQNKIKGNGLTYVRGCEFSCKYNGHKMHVLAYDFDPYAPEIAMLEQKIKDLYRERGKVKLKMFADAGYIFSKESMDFLNSKEEMRTTEFATCLVNDGYYTDRQTAIDKCVKKMKTPECGMETTDAISLMKKAGAKVVWAHSIHSIGEEPISFEEIRHIIKEIKPYGLDGLECYYSLYNKEQIENLLKIADEFGLFVTCGSDYHGKLKTVKIAECSCDGTKVPEETLKVRDIFKNTIK